MRFEIVVIGNDEGAFELTRQAARLGRRVAIVAPEKRHSAWMVQQGIHRLLRITTDSLADRNRLPAIAKWSPPYFLRRLLARSIQQVQQELLSSLDSAGAVVECGEALFLNANTIEVNSLGLSHCRVVTSDGFVVATGVRLQPALGHDGMANALSLEAVMSQPDLPKSVSLHGGHPLVADFRKLFRRFNVRIASFTESESRPAVCGRLPSTSRRAAGFHESATRESTSGHDGEIKVDCRRVVGHTSHLRLAALGILPDENGQLWCSDEFRTWCSSVYGFGNVVGFPELRELTPGIAATRLLACTRKRCATLNLPGPSWLRSVLGTKNSANIDSMHVPDRGGAQPNSS